MFVHKFREDLVILKNLIETKTNFALARISDGEYDICYDTYSRTYRDEYSYVKSGGGLYDKARNMIIDSSKMQYENYFYGVCLHGNDEHFNLTKKLTCCSDKNLTFASIFMESNYPYLMDEIFPLFKNFEVITFLTEKADISKLDLNIIKNFPMKNTAFINNMNELEIYENYVRDNDIRNCLILVGAGPFSNIIIQKLYSVQPENIYLNIGSSFDYILGLGETRGFFTKDSPTRNKIHYWK